MSPCLNPPPSPGIMTLSQQIQHRFLTLLITLKTTTLNSKSDQLQTEVSCQIKQPEPKAILMITFPPPPSLSLSPSSSVSQSISQKVQNTPPLFFYPSTRAASHAYLNNRDHHSNTNNMAKRSMGSDTNDN